MLEQSDIRFFEIQFRQMQARYDQQYAHLASLLLTLRQEIKKDMSDALATALAPLSAQVTQTEQDVLNIGTLQTAALAELQTEISQLQTQVASGGTILPADLTTIANIGSVLAQAHTQSQDIITNLGSITSPGTVTSPGTTSTP